ncbi:PIG-L deacetylase family protein [Paracoccus sp. (in: a-proteobacteria)]|uniref:PIG-L deacetylase family protein n=1 Tax=Paracoccus sp. TaxID=267 RepID=UPI0026DF4D39|nr:PIG-L deacetylase family protein [Paracoccus sp. (in: a-proteobacteria)]MDO5371521.1 PIG-L deacetylase family protein [Paracoccus sp. (in: a-proteobacteria)]
MRERDLAAILVPDDDDLPAMGAEDLLRGQPLLVLAPHPDDESLGCGALLARAFAGPGAHVACLTDGAASHPGSRAVSPARLAALRRGELEEALGHLGGTAEDATMFGVPDGQLRASPELAGRIAALARETGAGLLLAPSPLDPHCDHVAGAALGRAVARALPLRLGFYPVWSRWHGQGRAPVPPGTRAVRLPPGPCLPAKQAAIAAHRSQAGLVVPDAPDGFEMPPGFAAFFAARDEVYFLSDEGAPW